MAEPGELAAAADGTAHPRGSRRRRLWELPAPAQELLLGLSLAPECMRATMARVIGQQRAVRCVIQGSEVDVFFSALHDLTDRNVVSDAVHKLLDARHALAVRHLAAVREDRILRERWKVALDQPASADEGRADVPGLLWALLTHPCGEGLQEGLMHDVRCWMYARLRAGRSHDDQLRSLKGQRDALASDLARARVAANRAQTAATARTLADAALIACLRGELSRPVATEAAKQPVLPPQARPAAPSIARPADPLPLRFHFPLPLPLPNLLVATAQTHAAPRETTSPSGPVRAEVTEVLAGRKVLCVGGAQSAIARYRAIVESRGAQFSHHDGGIENGVRRLQAQLASADLVICQAGCINHEAYLRIKRHCKRTDTPCRYLQRPSLSQFTNCLCSPEALSASQDRR